jgi:hypothetical protein
LIRGLRQFRADFFEQAQLDLFDAFFGVQHQRFVFFHLRRDETLGIDQCLLADVMLWRFSAAPREISM